LLGDNNKSFVNIVTGKPFLWRMTMIKPKTTKKLNGFNMIRGFAHLNLSSYGYGGFGRY